MKETFDNSISDIRELETDDCESVLEVRSGVSKISNIFFAAVVPDMPAWKRAPSMRNGM